MQRALEGAGRWLADLRVGGDAVGGPAPFAKAGRSRFLQALDEAMVRLGRGA